MEELNGAGIYCFEEKGYRVVHIVADTEDTAITLYEDEVNDEEKDERLDALDCGYEYKPGYTVTKVPESEIEKIEILEPCGGLWSTPATKFIKRNAERGVTVPYILCEKVETYD